MNTVREARGRVMPPATETSVSGVLYQDNEVAV